VEAIFKESLSTAVTSNTVGKTLNSRGLAINKQVIKIMILVVIEKASNKSKNTGGTGNSNTIKIPIMPRAKATSPYLDKAFNLSDIVTGLLIVCDCTMRDFHI
jgi:hypothetical protein